MPLDLVSLYTKMDLASGYTTHSPLRQWLTCYKGRIDDSEPFVPEYVTVVKALVARFEAEGLLVASGPLEPRNGGALLLRIPDEAIDETLNRIRDNDPYTRAGMAQYELLPWDVKTGRADLDRA